MKSGNRKLLELIILTAFVLCACGKEEGNFANTTDISSTKLTIEEVKELSEKGEVLTWSDFEQYENRGDIGSGLYIIRYEMEEPYYVLVGGADTETIPMYIRLVSTQNADNYIDIRTESIDDFLAENYNQEWKVESRDVDTNASSPLDGVTMEVTEYSDTSVTVRITNDTDMDIRCGEDFCLNDACKVHFFECAEYVITGVSIIHAFLKVSVYYQGLQ